MASDPSIPCPMCGRMNPLNRKTCSTCDYSFVPASEQEEKGSVVKRVVGKLTRAR